MFEYIKEDQTKILDETTKNDLIAKIPKWYDSFDDARQEQRTDTETIREAIYGRKVLSTEKGKDWKSHCEMPDLYEKKDTLKAHLEASIYQNPENMFDVSGKDAEADAVATIQKAALVNSFEDMKIKFSLGKTIDNLIETGDMCLFVGWKQKTKQIRRKKTVVETQKEKIMQMFQLLTSDINLAGQKLSKLLGKTDNFVVYDELVYDGAWVKAIDPLNFVFDATMTDNWDSCRKIYRTFVTPDEINSNKVYKISKTDLADLKNISKKADNNMNNNLETDYNDKAVRDGQVELLELWGDIELEDGTILRNYLTVIAARKYVIRFEANPYIINPFVYGNIIEDPDTKRGISPLRIAIVINQISNSILNKNLDALALVTNPPYLAPKGCFKGDQEVKPGKIIEYDASLMPTAPVPIKLDGGLQGWEFIQFFQNEIETATGINKYLSGDIQGAKVDFATEAQGLMSGGNTRIGSINEAINNKIIIPMVEKVADLLANFKQGAENVPTKDKGGSSFQQITDEIRQGNYKYVYGDRKALQERKMKFKEMLEYTTRLLQDPELNENLDHIELAKFGYEQLGIDNTERFFLSPEEKQQKQMQRMMNGQIPSAGNPQFNGQQSGLGTIPPVPAQLPIQ